MIFYRKGQRGTTKKGEPIMYDIEEKINFAVFPGLQGGPHNHTIGALAVALKQANTPEFVEYQKQVLKNCARLSSELQSMGYEIVSFGQCQKEQGRGWRESGTYTGVGVHSQ
jgi:glycine hydroxymethyltransferase